MSGCHSRYGSNSKDDCSPSHSASIFYFVSTIAAMVVLGSITVLFFCCIYYKRRRITERLRNARSRAQQTGSDPVMFVWPGTASQASGTGSRSAEGTGDTQATGNSRGNVFKEITVGVEPVSCVIMAGEDRPTHLARPLPREELIDVYLGDKLEDMERGKRREP